MLKYYKNGAEATTTLFGKGADIRNVDDATKPSRLTDLTPQT